MLGMMNSPSDNVEFYSTNPKSNEKLTDQDRKTFTEVKNRDVITYTEDGRRLVNGKPEAIDTQTLWGNALLRGHVKANILGEEAGQSKEEASEDKETERERTDSVSVVEEPVLAAEPQKTTA